MDVPPPDLWEEGRLLGDRRLRGRLGGRLGLLVLAKVLGLWVGRSGHELKVVLGLLAGGARGLDNLGRLGGRWVTDGDPLVVVAGRGVGDGIPVRGGDVVSVGGGLGGQPMLTGLHSQCCC